MPNRMDEAIQRMQIAVSVFHVEENPDSAPLKKLVRYLDEAPVNLTL